MKKRRHHYVWQHYLSPWTSDKQIWCLRAGKIFQTSTVNIGQERDFYRIEELSSEDIEYIRVLAVNQSKGLLKQANEGWVHTFQLAFKYRDFFISKGVAPEDIKEIMDLVLNNIEEDFHATIESESIKYIDYLLSGNARFFDIEEDRMSFSHYLCVQYLRTKNIKESIIENMSSVPQLKHINIDGCWSIMRHVYATNMAFSLIASPKSYKLVIAKCPKETAFITGDQPIINTFAVIAGKNNIPTDTELYYPLSPTTALLVTANPEYTPGQEIQLEADDVKKYNNAIFESSFEQIYASSQNQLAQYAEQ